MKSGLRRGFISVTLCVCMLAYIHSIPATVLRWD